MWLIHLVKGQQWRCRNCGYRSCCAQVPGCRTFGPWPHDYTPMGTGKTILRHVKDAS
jgi:hypothetical protein